MEGKITALVQLITKEGDVKGDSKHMRRDVSHKMLVCGRQLKSVQLSEPVFAAAVPVGKEHRQSDIDLKTLVICRHLNPVQLSGQESAAAVPDDKVMRFGETA